MSKWIVFVSAFFVLSLSAFGQESIGIFDGSVDLRDPTPPGVALYNSETKQYTVTCGGSSVRIEAAHHVYRVVNGDFRIKAKIRTEDLGNSHENAAGFLFVEDDSLEWDTSYYTWWLTVKNELLGAWQISYGGSFAWGRFISPDEHNGLLELVREGDMCSVYYFDPDSGEPILYDQREIELSDPVYAGIGVGSWKTNETTVAYFTEVEMIVNGIPVDLPSAVNDWSLFK